MYRVEWSKQAKEGLSKIGDRVKESKIKKRMEAEKKHCEHWERWERHIIS